MRRAAVGLLVVPLLVVAAGCGSGANTAVTVTSTRTVTTTHTVTKQSAPSAPACTGDQLSASFDVVPGSAGAGQVEYVLTVQNTSQTHCFVSGLPQVKLLGADGSPLPTHPVAAQQTPAPKVELGPGDSARAQVRLSPDVSGTGDAPSGPCQPKAQTLQVTPNGGGTTMGPVTPPTSVCEQGTLELEAYSSGSRSSTTISG